MYRTFFRRRFEQFNELAHRRGARTMFHSCGKITELVGEFVDAGLDVLQSLQPAAIGSDAAWIKRQFGRRLSFQGGIDIQGVLPHGSPAQVRDHVKQVVATYGPEGYILGTAHNILPDVPTANILAMIDAWHELR
jgi:uroporphyrinogen decarboxylase